MDHDCLKANTAIACDVIEALAVRLAVPADDRTTFICWAALELLARRLGPAGAIEQLRNIADVAEAELLHAAG